MDARTLAGKTLFFILICVFVSGFSSVFGPENNLVGVIIIVLALTMLSRDLSVRPVWNLGVMCACTLAMGAFSFLSVWLGNPFAGAVLNFAFVFGACFYAMHDLNSPMHFPFLLGYAFMLSVPVAAEDLPLRLLALVAGSVFVVGLNVLFHHVSKGRREREGMIAICDEVASLCVSARAGAAAGTDRLDELCGRMDGYLYERLKSRFLSRPGDRRMLDIVVSLQVLGTVVSLRERDPAVLDGIEDIAHRLSSYQKGEDIQPLLDSVDAFLRDRPESDPETRAALRLLRDQLWRLSFSTSADRFDTADIPASFRIGTVLRESLRRDSARFTFSFRMALMFSLCAFVWQYTGDDNAKALAFTTIAMIQPYLEGTARRAALRLVGTVAGIAAAIASLVIAGGDLAVLTAIMLVSNYVFTVLSPMRYEAMMGFVTLSSLLTAIMTNPPETVLTERVAFVFAGVLIASVANRVVLPYRLSDENPVLCRRYLDITLDQIRCLGESADGRQDRLTETALVLKAATVSSKIRTNLTQRADLPTRVLLSRQDRVTTGAALASRSLSTAGSGCRDLIHGMVSGFDPGSRGDVRIPDLSGLEQKESDLVRQTADVLNGYLRDSALLEAVEGRGRHL